MGKKFSGFVNGCYVHHFHVLICHLKKKKKIGVWNLDHYWKESNEDFFVSFKLISMGHGVTCVRVEENDM